MENQNGQTRMTKAEAFSAWRRRPSKAVTAAEILRFEREWTPNEIDRLIDREMKYRKGYRHGIQDSIDAISRLKQSGFVRVSEIINILVEFQDRQVTPWCAGYRVATDIETKDGALSGTPPMNLPSWFELREQVFARDGKECCWCGSEDELHIDHIEPVYEGGLPKLENLRVLCATCHRTR